MTNDSAEWEAIKTLKGEVRMLRKAKHEHGNLLQEHEAFIRGQETREAQLARSKYEMLSIYAACGSAVLSSLTAIALALLH